MAIGSMRPWDFEDPWQREMRLESERRAAREMDRMMRDRILYGMSVSSYSSGNMVSGGAGGGSGHKMMEVDRYEPERIGYNDTAQSKKIAILEKRLEEKEVKRTEDLQSLIAYFYQRT